MKYAHLLGIPVHSLPFSQVVSHIQQLLQSGSQHQVVTLNNEMLVAAASDKEFYTVLKQSSFNPPDSAGVVLFGRALGGDVVERASGIDVITALCAQLSATESLFLLGGKEGVADMAAQTLQCLNSDLRIVGTASGSPAKEDSQQLIDQINQAKPTLLLVAYGAPAQDKWIASHLTSMPSVHVAIGVGGAFDFLAGTITRAPLLLRTCYLEWLWRLILQPCRIGRIFNAVILFPFLVLRYGKSSPYS